MPESSSARVRRLALAGSLIALVVALDQWTKLWALEHLRGHQPRVIRPGLLELHFSFNPGSAFGMFADKPGARPIFVAITAVALVYMGALMWRLPARPRSRAWARVGTVGLALMAGGAIGNLVDRLTRIYDVRVRWHRELPFWVLIEHPREVAQAMLHGRAFADVPRHGVVDFILIYYWPGMRWPSFNLADAGLVAGVALFLLFLLRNARDQET